MITKSYILDLFHEAFNKDDYGWYTYQPINCPGYEVTLNQSGRKCSDRSEAIIKHIKNNIDNYESKIFIDWGCNLGYFIFDLMKNNCRSIGIDRSKKYIEMCNFVKNEHYNSINNKNQPIFIVDNMDDKTIQNYSADIAFCFSVFHHIKHKQFKTVAKFANQYDQAYVEMDGHNYGYDFLKVFYWDLDLVIEVSDKYGKGNRRRKTWFCNNIKDSCKYENIKNTNLLSGRGVFKKTNLLLNAFKPTVLKREKLSFKHTWIETNIEYEAHMYRKYTNNFLPSIINYSENEEDRILELEFIDESSEKGASIDSIFDWLKDNNLKILDCSASQFIKTKNGFVLLDLESIVPADQIGNYLKKDNIVVKSHEKQITYLKNNLFL